MGSTQSLLTVEETAQVLGISYKQVQRIGRAQLLEAHYPKGLKAGQHFLEEDVLALRELRNSKDTQANLPQLAMRAIITSKRVERQFEQLCAYLGLRSERLKNTKEEVIALFHEAGVVTTKAILQEAEILRWATVLLSIDEEYLDCVQRFLGEEEPWRRYYELYNNLIGRGPPDQLHAMLTHARRNLQNVTYFYVRGAHGEHAANRVVPRDGYAKKVMQTLMPIH